MSNQYFGACLCNAIRFQVNGQFEHFYLCHCDHCRKDTGSAHAANLFSSKANLTWISGQDKVTIYHLPGTRHTKCFCSTCGSALPYTAGQMVVVPAGSLERTFSMTPDAHIFIASKAQWDEQLGQVPMFKSYLHDLNYFESQTRL